MSLISDALKAAEAERSRGSPRSHEAARQMLHWSAERRTAVRGAAEWLRRPVRLPRHIRLAMGIVGGAVALSTAIILSRPPRMDAPPDALALGVVAPFLSAHADQGLASSAGLLQNLGNQAETAESGLPIPVGGAQTVASQPVAQAERPAGTTATVAPPAEPAGMAPVAIAGGNVPALPEAASSPAAQDRRQLSAQELRVNASARPNGELFAAAVSAQQRREFPGAIALYQQILVRDINDVEVLNNLGVSYQALGELESARGAFQRALAIEPRYAAAWSNLGVALGALGLEADARTAFGEAIRQDPSNLGTKVNLALLHQRQGLPSEAKRLLQEVVAADQTMAEAHFALAGMFETEGNASAALRHYRLFLSTGASRFPNLEPVVAQRINRLEGRR